jgi:GNAT superfamily N-acetyltransferase
MLSSGRNKIQDDTWELRQVEDFSEFINFDCDDSDLNDFIQKDANDHAIQLLAKTYSLKPIAAGGKIPPVAFISLMNDAIPLSETQKKELPDKKQRYRYYPAVKIARLGVQKIFQGRNIGTHLINLTKIIFTTNNRTGCRFLTVDAYNQEKVIKFYNKNDFKFLKDPKPQNRTCQMFYDLLRFKIQDA